MVSDFFAYSSSYCRENRDSSPVILRPHSEVHPVVAIGVALNKQFIELLLTLVADVQQDGGIAQGLFDAIATDVSGTARQVVRVRGTTHRLVHLETTVPAVDDDGVVTLTITLR